ncbi:hypothetical protein SESBI_07884 [Sesbania bispinosa]|nr:hypothetical protein SESBI_07884 [Sesbania bispinosa]
MTHRRLSFSLEDFPRAEGERGTRATTYAAKQAQIPSSNVFDLEPPLADIVLTASYPCGYQPPAFQGFDGTRSAKEHIMSFLDDLGIRRNNKNLPLKEFSKLLSGRAFTRYAKLRPYSIETWEDLATEFCGKLLEEEGALYIMDLGRVKQKSGEGLVAFINELMTKVADVVDAMKRQGKKVQKTLKGCLTYALPGKEKGKRRSRATAFLGKPHSMAQTRLGKVLLPEVEQGGDLHRRPLPKHNVNTIIPSSYRIRIEEI